MHSPHPSPSEREEFLVDGCPRCKEYADELGIFFDQDRWAAFWKKMLEVEFGDGHWTSRTDAMLGGRLYLVALGLQRQGIDIERLVP